MLRLPIGYSDFKQIIDNKQDLVDKTNFISEVVEDAAEVILITRPRRFGKTLNLSMLRYFFSNKSQESGTAHLFDGFNIAKNKAFCSEYQGKYPVIFLTCKDIKSNTFTEAYAHISSSMHDVYSEHRYLLLDPEMRKEDKAIYQSILERRATVRNLAKSLQNLTEYLYRYHRQRAVILIDEYDTPMQSGYISGYYDEIASFFSDFFCAALKDNAYLFKAVLTGILSVSREIAFSGLNNVTVHSVLDPKYAPYFGFTEAEVSDLLKAGDWSEKADEVKAWYNGYQIGDVVLYNPWSIVNWIADQIFEPYWINTSGNDLIEEILLKSDIIFNGEFELLFKDQPVSTAIDYYFVCADLQKRGDCVIWSFLLMTGYLKAVSVKYTELGAQCLLAIPNKEVSGLYKKIIQKWLSCGHANDWRHGFMENLLNGNMTQFSQDLRKIMEQIVSLHDVTAKPEAFYHALTLGLTSSLHQHPDYEIQSNRESREGRYDYLIISRDPAKLSIIFEFEFKRLDIADKKKSDKAISKKLQQAAETALAQIDTRNYPAELKQRGLTNILTIGIAFSGRKLGIAYKYADLQMV